jgi:hypothetical protein
MSEFQNSFPQPVSHFCLRFTPQVPIINYSKDLAGKIYVNRLQAAKFLKDYEVALHQCQFRDGKPYNPLDGDTGAGEALVAWTNEKVQDLLDRAQVRSL